MAFAVDAQRDDAGVLAKVHPVQHQGGQLEMRQVGGYQLGQRDLGGGDEPSRDRRLGGALRPCLNLAAHRLQAKPVTAGGELAEHLVQRHAVEHLGAAVDGTHPRAANGNPAPAQGDRPSLGAVPYGGALAIVTATRTADLRDRLIHHRAHHLKPSADGQGQHALAHRGSDLLHRHGHALRHDHVFDDLPGRPALVLVGLTHGGPHLTRSSLAVTRDLPPGRPRAGDRHFKFYELRDNLGAGAVAAVLGAMAVINLVLFLGEGPWDVVTSPDLSAGAQPGFSSAGEPGIAMLAAVAYALAAVALIVGARRWRASTRSASD